MKNFWLDKIEKRKIQTELCDIFKALLRIRGSFEIDWKYIENLQRRLEELEGKNA